LTRNQHSIGALPNKNPIETFVQANRSSKFSEIKDDFEEMESITIEK
jgi:hypothetical protein